jgi:hypothetical protein
MGESAAQKRAREAKEAEAQSQGSQPDDEGQQAKLAAEGELERQPGIDIPEDDHQARTEDQMAANPGNFSGAQAGGRGMEAAAVSYGARAAKARAADGAEEGEYVVLFDHYAWLETDDESGEVQRYDARFRQRVYLSAKEAGRGLKLGAIAKPEDVQGVMARRSMKPTDAQLQNMSAEQLTAYLVQNADDSARVYRLETQREDGGRQEVLGATGNLADHQD